MISCRLIGALGNQLSQVATTYVLALDNGDECAFNLYHREEPGFSGHGPEAYKPNIYKKLKELPLSWTPQYVYREPRYDYDPIPYHSNMLLEGYFCSNKYIDHRRTEVLDLFKDKETISSIQGEFKNSLSLHVRRGDYINKPTVHPFLTADYYEKALRYMDDHAQIDIIYVFTENKILDDISWCMNNLKDKRMVFMAGRPDYLDLYTMSLCSHHIIANSSFSAWGSYLN
jgi:hypothetical protein